MIGEWLTAIFYQPLLNLLVLVYWALQQLPFNHQDMGVAVIIFTIAFRILWFPISRAAKRSEAERKRLEDKYQEITESLAADPVKLKAETKQVFREKPAMVLAAITDILLQAGIALMLWRLFAKGLLGEDLHLIYSFIPHPQTPYNLSFWGIFDLTKPNNTLNLLQSLMILLVEALNLWTTPYPINRKDVLRLLIFLPVVSFLIFMFLPAGKKLFIITTLVISLIINLWRQIHYLIVKKYLKTDEVKVDFSPPEE